MDCQCEVSTYKLLYLERLNNRALLYITGNYIQSPGIDYDGKEYKQKGTHMYVCLSHFAVEQKLAQHYKSTIILKNQKNSNCSTLVLHTNPYTEQFPRVSFKHKWAEVA